MPPRQLDKQSESKRKSTRQAVPDNPIVMRGGYIQFGCEYPNANPFACLDRLYLLRSACVGSFDSACGCSCTRNMDVATKRLDETWWGHPVAHNLHLSFVTASRGGNFTPRFIPAQRMQHVLLWRPIRFFWSLFGAFAEVAGKMQTHLKSIDAKPLAWNPHRGPNIRGLRARPGRYYPRRLSDVVPRAVSPS